MYHRSQAAPTMSRVRGARARGDGLRRHQGFGLVFVCDLPLPGFPAAPGGREPDLDMLLAAPDDVAQAWSGPAHEPAAVELTIDGLPYRVERGVGGDHRFSYGDLAAFHLSPDARTLLCSPADAADPAWRRVLLDSVLATVALLHGFEALHAAAVAGSDGVVAFMGRTGGGKTTLAAELVRRGLPLVCDDVLALTRDGGGAILAHPAPPVMNLPHAAPPVAAQRLASFGDEDWVAIEHAATGPARLAAVCVLDRRSGLDAAIQPAETSALDLLAHGLRSGRAPERMEARFELLADIAEQVPAFILEADPCTHPARLADLAESAIPGLRAVVAAGPVR